MSANKLKWKLGARPSPSSQLSLTISHPSPGYPHKYLPYPTCREMAVLSLMYPQCYLTRCPDRLPMTNPQRGGVTGSRASSDVIQNDLRLVVETVCVASENSQQVPNVKIPPVFTTPHPLNSSTKSSCCGCYNFGGPGRPPPRVEWGK